MSGGKWTRRKEWRWRWRWRRREEERKGERKK